MNLRTLAIISVVIIAMFSSCKDEETVLGNWVKKAYLEGSPRANGISFSVNGKGYFGMGRDDDGYFRDVWEYDPGKDVYTQVGDFPGTPRAFSVSLNTESKGYVAMGYDGDNDLADFWEYEASTDTWTQLSDFPDGERRNATGFAIGNDVYIGTGTSNDGKTYHNDFYKYSAGNWSKISFGGDKRTMANATSLNGKGYLIGGYRSGNINDMYEFDPETEIWTPLDKLTDDDTGDSGLPRYDAICYSAAGYIYLIGGSGSTNAKAVYEWDSESRSWEKKNPMESNIIPRQGAGVFVIDGNGYFVGGRTGSTYFDDCYMYEPFEELDSDD